MSYEFSFLRLSVRPSVQNENLKNGSSVFFTSGGPKKSPKWSKIRILGGFDKNLTHSCVLFLLWNMKVLNGCLQKPYFWEKSVELWPTTSRPIWMQILYTNISFKRVYKVFICDKTFIEATDLLSHFTGVCSCMFGFARSESALAEEWVELLS